METPLKDKWPNCRQFIPIDSFAAPRTKPVKQRSTSRALVVLSILAFGLAGTATANAQSSVEPYSVSTIAGATPAIGGDNISADNALKSPSALAADRAGNLFVANTESHTICKVTPDGLITTFAGAADSPGYANGVGGAAHLSYPKGVAVDAAGNVYVADAANQVIRKITPAGVVSTLAGQAGLIGNVDGAGSIARFYYPYGVAVDGAGDVYVADTFNSTIRKITPAGMVSTVAGRAGNIGHADGANSRASFNYPSGLAVIVLYFKYGKHEEEFYEKYICLTSHFGRNAES